MILIVPILIILVAFESHNIILIFLAKKDLLIESSDKICVFPNILWWMILTTLNLSFSCSFNKHLNQISLPISIKFPHIYQIFNNIVILFIINRFILVFYYISLINSVWNQLTSIIFSIALFSIWLNGFIDSKFLGIPSMT